jgi:ATP-binding cassette subfamily C protein CydC
LILDGKSWKIYFSLHLFQTNSLLLIQNNRLDIIFVAVFYLIFLSMFESIQNLSLTSNLMGEIDHTRTRLDQISDNQEKITGKIVGTISEILPIKIQNVSFRYNSNDKNVIENLNLTIHKNEKIAIVGRNGSGKTTFLDLLSGFYNIFSGQILCGSNEIRNLDNDSYRLRLSYINSSPYIFSTSLMKNLMLANPDCNEYDVKKILNLMKLDTRFMSANDLNLTEKGRNISSGEKQKIEIARCLLRKSELILLDEPLSNIDPLFMNEINQDLHSFFEQKTVIWVTHQFINMEFFDKIFVFDHGSIIEEGSHFDLLSKKGAYFKLVSGI